MDSMKTLNTSLPRTPRRHGRSARPSEQLLQVFRSAALSVTNLYRTAEANENQAREDGYQAALDDLLMFLDRENIGLCDGEGWRVRQWITEKSNETMGLAPSSDSEEDRDYTRQTTAPQPTQSQKSQADPPRERAEEASDMAPNTDCSIQAAPHDNISLPPSEVFTFRATQELPPDTSIELHDITKIGVPSTDHSSQNRRSPSFKLNVLSSKHGRSAGTIKQISRSSSGRHLGSGAGTKRRVPVGDYFGLASLDSSRESKRGKT